MDMQRRNELIPIPEDLSAELQAFLDDGKSQDFRVLPILGTI